MQNHAPPPPDRDAKILVVGAGPAGLTAAMSLQEAGYTDVVVFEKDDQVGGKCRNFYHNGFAYDLGANLTTPRYVTVRALAERLGIGLKELPERRIVNLTQDDVPTLGDANVLTRTAIRAAALYYVAARQLTGIDRQGYAGLRDGVERPFGEWLDKHGLGAFRPVFANLFVAYGYGVMEELPAAYALKFFDPVHLWTAIDTLLGENPHTTKVIDGGFQRLWVTAVAELGLDVRTSTHLTSVRRVGGHVEAAWTDADGDHEGRFDRLLIACPLDAALGFLDASTAEQELFSQVAYYDYYVTATVLNGLPDISTYVYPYSMKYTPGEPTVFYPPVPEDAPDDVFMFYAYGDASTTEQGIHDNIRTLLARPEFDAQLDRILHTQHWRYFPHISSDAMRAGWYDQVDALQGQRSTYYFGEVLSFTFVELVMRHSRWMVNRFFR